MKFTHGKTPRKIMPLTKTRKKMSAPDKRKQNVERFRVRLHRLADTFPINNPVRAYILNTPGRPNEIATWWENGQWETFVIQNGGGEDAYQSAMNQWELTLDIWVSQPANGLMRCHQWLVNAGVQFP